MRHVMDDGTWVDTKNAMVTWQENKWWDGNNQISCATNSQWEHETLYLSKRGRYYVVRTSQYSSVRDCVSYLTDVEAVLWLIRNDREIPEKLTSIAAELEG
jgi:hypothetical protein